MPYNFNDLWVRRRAPFRTLWKIAFGGNIPVNRMLSINIEEKIDLIIQHVLNDYEERTVGVRRISFSITAASHLLYGLAVVYRKKIVMYLSEAQADFIAERQLRINLIEGREQDEDQRKKKRRSASVGYRERLWAKRLRRQRFAYTEMAARDQPPATGDNEQAIPAFEADCIDLPLHTLPEDINEAPNFSEDEDFGNLSIDALLFHYMKDYPHLRKYWEEYENQVPAEGDQAHPEMPTTPDSTPSGERQIATTQPEVATPETSTVSENIIQAGIHDMEYYNDLRPSESDVQERLQEYESRSNLYPDVSDIVLPPLETQPAAGCSRRRRIQKGMMRNARDTCRLFPMFVLEDNIMSPQSTQRALWSLEDIILPNSLAYSSGTLLLKTPRKQILSRRIQTLIARNYCLPTERLGGQDRQYLEGRTFSGQDHSHISPKQNVKPSTDAHQTQGQHGQNVVSNQISIDEDIDMSCTGRNMPGTSGMSNRTEKKGTQSTILECSETLEWPTRLPVLEDIAGTCSHFDRQKNDYQPVSKKLKKRKVETIKCSFLEICSTDSNNRKDAARCFNELLNMDMDKQVTLKQTAYNMNVPETAFAPIYIYKKVEIFD